jgi:hypothetical protein
MKYDLTGTSRVYSNCKKSGIGFGRTLISASFILLDEDKYNTFVSIL